MRRLHANGSDRNCIARCVAEALEPRRLLSALPTDLGVWNPKSGVVKLDYNDNGGTSASFKFGQSGDQLVAGPFAGNTITGLADYRAGTWYISNNADGVIDQTVQFGNAKSIALAGDMRGNGVADLVTYNPKNGVWKICDNRDGVVSQKVTFGGSPGDIPLLGDFNGDGKDDLVIYNAGTWEVSYDADGKVDATYNYGGATGDIPIVADISGDTQPALGIYLNGTWTFDTNYDGVSDVQYTKGSAKTVPLAGFFNEANSIFVQAGASDSNNGSVNSPVGTLTQALQLSSPGDIIRIAPGNYPENVLISQKSNLTFVGAGQEATHVDPTNGDAMFMDRSTNISFYDLNMDPSSPNPNSIGRGFILQASSVVLRGVSTDGTYGYGLLAGASGLSSTRSTVDAQYCHFDQSVAGEGMWLQDSVDVTLMNDTFDGNGTDQSAIISSPQGGVGLLVSGSSTAKLNKDHFNSNANSGLIAYNTPTLNIKHSTFSNNTAGDGALIQDNVAATFNHDTFASNGTIQSVAAGFNGIEFFGSNFVGTSTVSNSMFLDNTGFGVFIGAGTVTVNENTFNGNSVGVGVYGILSGTSATADITGNTFDDDGSGEGVFGEGPGATATIGGTTSAQENSFTDLNIGIDDNHGPGQPSSSDSIFTILNNTFSGNTLNVRDG